MRRCDNGDVRQRRLQVQQRPRLRTDEDLLRQPEMHECEALRRHRPDEETKLDAERARPEQIKISQFS